MRNGEMLKDELRHRKISQEQAAKAINTSVTTFFRKLNDPNKSFTTEEAYTLVKELKLDSKTALRIFFS